MTNTDISTPEQIATQLLTATRVIVDDADGTQRDYYTRHDDDWRLYIECRCCIPRDAPVEDFAPGHSDLPEPTDEPRRGNWRRARAVFVALEAMK